MIEKGWTVQNFKRKTIKGHHISRHYKEKDRNKKANKPKDKVEDVGLNKSKVGYLNHGLQTWRVVEQQ